MDPLHLVAELGAILCDPDPGGAPVDASLRRLGEHLDCSRAYLLRPLAEPSQQRAWEWRASVDAEVPSSPRSLWLPGLDAEGLLRVRDVAEHPEPDGPLLAERGVKATLLVAQCVTSPAAVYLGVEDHLRVRDWKDEEVVLLRATVALLQSRLVRQSSLEALHDVEACCQKLLDGTDVLTLLADGDGNLVYASAAIQRILGLHPSEVVARPLLERFAHHEVKSVQGAFAEMLHGHPARRLPFLTSLGTTTLLSTQVSLQVWRGQPHLAIQARVPPVAPSPEHRLGDLFANCPSMASLTLLKDGRLLRVNRAYCDALGYREDELLGTSATNLTVFADPSEEARIVSALTERGQVDGYPVTLRRKDGRLLRGVFAAGRVEHELGPAVVAMIQDVTEQHEQRMRLEEERNHLMHLIDATHLGTWDWNVQTGEAHFNERWAQIVGYRLSELAPASIKTWLGLAHPEDLLLSGRLLAKHFAQETTLYECEARMKHKDGHWVWVLDRGKVIEWDSEQRPVRMVGTHMDITEKRQLQDRIREVSIHDELTGVFTRRHILERMEELSAESARGQRIFSLCLLDLDHFKDINDTYGHLEGDAALRGLAGLLSSMVRPYDLVGRFGGEEFLVVLPSLVRQQAQVAMQRVLEEVRKHRLVPGAPGVTVTFSCGIVESTECSLVPNLTSAMLDVADKRLYAAKHAGRNRIVSE